MSKQMIVHSFCLQWISHIIVLGQESRHFVAQALSLDHSNPCLHCWELRQAASEDPLATLLDVVTYNAMNTMIRTVSNVSQHSGEHQ